MTGLPDRTEVAILGAGAAGLSLALELSRRGVETVVVDTAPSDEWDGAVGLINPQAHPGIEPEPVRDLSLLARHLYADWIESIEEEAGLSCEYDVRGGLTVALTDEEEVQLDRALDWQRARSLPFEVLAAEEAREREPALGGGIQAAFAFPLDGQLAPSRLRRALALAARRAGARLTTRVPILSLVIEEGRAAGIETAAGRLLARLVVRATGTEPAAVAGAPAAPGEILRAEMALLDASADPERLTRFVCGSGVALVPRRDGTLVVAGSFDRARFDSRPTAAGVAASLERAVRIVPAAGAYPLLATGAGFVANSPDGVPLLGETALPGYFLATACGPNEFLLAPASAVLVADLVTGQRPPLPPAPFSPARLGV